MWLIDNFIDVMFALSFIDENIDLIIRCIEKADMIFESYFTECWIEGGFDE